MISDTLWDAKESIRRYLSRGFYGFYGPPSADLRKRLELLLEVLSAFAFEVSREPSTRAPSRAAATKEISFMIFRDEFVARDGRPWQTIDIDARELQNGGR